MKTDLGLTGCICDVCMVAKNKPEACPNRDAYAEVRDRALATYRGDAYTDRIMTAHAGLLGRGSSKWPRLEHIREFCVQMNVTRVGLACCSMFLPQAKAVADYLAEKDIESVTVCCKLGALKLEQLNIDRGAGRDYHLCNSVAQAYALNESETELNVLLGLCAPHDMLLAWHAEAPCTTLFAKEHLTNHAPYQSIAAMVKGVAS